MQYTLRNVPDALDHALRKRAKKENKSLNQLLLDLIEIRVGTKKEKQFTRRYDDLDTLFGRWSQREFEAIQGKIDEERAIDPELWK